MPERGSTATRSHALGVARVGRSKMRKGYDRPWSEGRLSHAKPALGLGEYMPPI